jgi:hypothetical protein
MLSRVGILIENGDIAVLEAGLIETVQPDIKRVYTNLLNGRRITWMRLRQCSKSWAGISEIAPVQMACDF